MRLETIKIENEAEKGGYAIINAADFDAKTMTKFGTKNSAGKPTPKKPAKNNVQRNLTNGN